MKVFTGQITYRTSKIPPKAGISLKTSRCIRKQEQEKVLVVDLDPWLTLRLEVSDVDL